MPQRVEGGEHGLSAGGGVQVQAVEQGGQEPADVAAAGQQLLGPRLGFSGQLADGVDRGGELVTGDAALVQHRPHLEKAAVGWVKQHRDGVAELTSGDVESRQPAQPFPLLDALGAGQKSASSRSSRSSMSSVASVSSCRATASRVAVRRGSAIRDRAGVRAAWACRARVAMRPGGTADRSSSPTPS